MAVAWSSSGGVAQCYVLPVLWMTSCLAVMGRMGLRVRPERLLAVSYVRDQGGVWCLWMLVEWSDRYTIHIVFSNYLYSPDASLSCLTAFGIIKLLKPPSHLAEMKQNQPELTIFKIRATFGQDCRFKKNFKNAVRILRIHANPHQMILAHSSVLALECRSNVVGTQ